MPTPRCCYCDHPSCSCILQRDKYIASVYFPTLASQEQRYRGLPFTDKWEIHHTFRNQPKLAMKLIRNNVCGLHLLLGLSKKIRLNTSETKCVTLYVDAHIRPIAHNLWTASDRTQSSQHYWHLAKQSLVNKATNLLNP